MNASLKRIICCGFSPCVQRIIEFQQLEKGAVNRATRVTIGLGGKGVNTARMVKQLGGEPLLIGFVGGDNGKLLEEMLDAEDVGYRHVMVEGETRICQTLVEEGRPESTELVEEMPPLTSDNWPHMLKLFHSLELADAVVTISGKLPAGAPVEAYAQLCRWAHDAGGRIILDAPGEPLLRALEHEPAMVKINDVELLTTLNTDNLQHACRELLRFGAQSVLITRGSHSALYMDNAQSLEIFPPEIIAVNPVGSGDAVTAGMAVDLSRGKDRSAAVITGMACGAANALNLVSGRLKPEDIARLRPDVKVQQVG